MVSCVVDVSPVGLVILVMLEVLGKGCTLQSRETLEALIRRYFGDLPYSVRGQIEY